MRLHNVPRGGVVGFDLECRPSAFWFGDVTTSEITAFGWKWVGRPDVHTLLLLRDGRFLTDTGRKLRPAAAYRLFVDELAAAALVFGHNIRQFDLPTLTAGLLRLKLPRLPAMLTCDTLKDQPRTRGKAKNLATLAAEHGLGEKIGLSQHDWEQANRLSPDGIEKTRERVVSDVLLQEQLRSRMLELAVLKPPRVWTP